MDKGRIIGIVGFIAGAIFAWTFLNLSYAYGPEPSPPFLLLALLFVEVGGIILFYSFTMEGNIWLSRRFLGSNDGVAPMIEKGKFLRFIRINYNEDEFKKGDGTYKIDQEKTYFRKGSGIPYTFYRHDKLEPLSLYEEASGVEPRVVTGMYFSRLAVFKSLIFDQQFKLIILVAAGVGILVILSAVLTFALTSDLKTSMDALAVAITALKPTPTPGAIPGV